MTEVARFIYRKPGKEVRSLSHTQDANDACFIVAQARRKTLRKELQALDVEIDRLEEAQAACRIRLDELETCRHQMDRHAAAAFRANRAGKAWQKVERRRAYSKAASSVRARLRELDVQLSALYKRQKEAAADLQLASIEFYEARHWKLRAIAHAARQNPAQQEELMRFIKLAGVPYPYRNWPDRVWHYTVRNAWGKVSEVHLFWGGERSPLRNGWSPDGIGHAHYILAMRSGRLKRVFARDAVRRTRRMDRLSRRSAQLTA